MQSVAVFVVVGEGMGRRRSGIEVAKRIIRMSGTGELVMEEEEEVDIMFLLLYQRWWWCCRKGKEPRRLILCIKYRSRPPNVAQAHTFFFYQKYALPGKKKGTGLILLQRRHKVYSQPKVES